MKGLIDYYIISLDKIEKELRKDSIEKTLNYRERLEPEEILDEEFNVAINRILEGF